jgi:glycerophosphoryl diester phosphodiesterase
MTGSFSERSSRSGLLVFGHRGAKAIAPENTLVAFQVACDAGADGIEFDVQLSSDGVAVVIHDASVERTTNGAGRVADLSLEQLRTLDAGSWFDAAYAKQRIPTLEQVLETFAGKLLFNIELKADVTDADALAHAVARALTRHSDTDSVIVSSFNPLALVSMQREYPNVPIGFLFDEVDHDVTQWALANLDLFAVHPHESLVDAAFMSMALARGWMVNTWTVNEPDRSRQLRDLGISILISDAPYRILSSLRV